MSIIKTQLQELSRHYATARAVGHTTAIIEGAKNVPRCIIVAANQRSGEHIEGIVGPASDVMVIGLPGIRDGRLVGLARPVLLDNFAMLVLTSDALAEIERLEKDKAGLIQDVNNLERGQRTMQEEIDKLRAEKQSLERWKAEALEVEAQWDVQAIAKLIDVPLGDHIRPHIEPKLRQLMAQHARATLIMGVALLRFSRWSLRQGERHKVPRTGDYPPAVQSVMDKMRTFLEQPPASNQAAADWFESAIRELRALPPGALDAEFVAVLTRYFSHPGAQFPVEIRMALESVRDTAIAMKDSLKILPPTGGSVLLVEAPERLRATACGALEKLRNPS